MADQYDYVIVGAGSAGCVLANRLSADPNVRVALLEAGGRDRKLEIKIPAAFPKLFHTAYDWDLFTKEQKELAGRELYWPRGKTLGGSSSINAQMWVRGARADYDTWGVPGWSYDEVLPYFHRAERRHGSNAGETYGTDGPLWIEELRSPNPLRSAFFEACAEAGMQRLPELNVPDIDGYAPTPVNQHHGRRWSAADGYLHPVRKRPNLTVLTGAMARRIRFIGKRATGVAYRVNGGPLTEATATREVIVSAGAVHSPNLLQLSGIGDPSILRDADVEPILDLPAVGQNLQDHLSTAVIMYSPDPVTLVDAEKPAELIKFVTRRRGMLTSNVGEAVALLPLAPLDPGARPRVHLRAGAVHRSRPGRTAGPRHHRRRDPAAAREPRQRDGPLGRSVGAAEHRPWLPERAERSGSAGRGRPPVPGPVRDVGHATRTSAHRWSPVSTRPISRSSCAPRPRRCTTRWAPAGWAPTTNRWSTPNCGCAASTACASSTHR